MQRRRFLGTLGALALGTLAVGALGPAADAFAQAKPLAIEVYKSPLCGCCEEWVKHLRTNGFAVTVHDV